MRRCSSCHKNKHLKSFCRDHRSKDGRCARCKTCTHLYHKEHRLKNPELHLAKRREVFKKNRLWFDELRTTLKCSQCGFKHPGALQFHHRDPKQKVQNIAYMVIQSWSRERVLEEIAKCDVLCANCHFILHYERRRNTSSTTKK